MINSVKFSNEQKEVRQKNISNLGINLWKPLRKKYNKYFGNKTQEETRVDAMHIIRTKCRNLATKGEDKANILRYKFGFGLCLFLKDLQANKSNERGMK